MVSIEPSIFATQEDVLFKYKDVLSLQGLHGVWMDALELSRHPNNVPYGDITTEDIICGAVAKFGLMKVTQSGELRDAIVQRAKEFADYEHEQFSRGVIWH